MVSSLRLLLGSSLDSVDCIGYSVHWIRLFPRGLFSFCFSPQIYSAAEASQSDYGMKFPFGFNRMLGLRSLLVPTQRRYVKARKFKAPGWLD